MKKHVSVKLDADGNVSGVLFEGNKRPTPATVLKRLIEEGKVEGFQIVKKKKKGDWYIRTIADESKDNNLDTLSAAVQADEQVKDQTWEALKEAEQAVEAGEAPPADEKGLLAKLKAVLAKINPLG